MAESSCELLSFSLVDLNRMKGEFLEAYEDLFSDAYQRLYRTLKIKLETMQHCQNILDSEIKAVLQKNLKARMLGVGAGHYQ